MQIKLTIYGNRRRQQKKTTDGELCSFCSSTKATSSLGAFNSPGLFKEELQGSSVGEFGGGGAIDADSQTSRQMLSL